MVDLLREDTHRELRPRRIKTRGNLAGKRELYGEDIRPPPKTFCNKNNCKFDGRPLAHTHLRRLLLLEHAASVIFNPAGID